MKLEKPTEIKWNISMERFDSVLMTFKYFLLLKGSTTLRALL